MMGGRVFLMGLAAVLLCPCSGWAEGGLNGHDNPLDPTPAASPDAVVREMSWRKLKASPLPSGEKGIKALEIVGAVTRLKDGRLGFMPLRQHHMAVEHWFLNGIKPEDLGESLKDSDRCYVKLAGQCELKGVFGEECDFYGNGLEHGNGLQQGDASGPAAATIEGYHERVYVLKVDKVIWAKNAKAFQAMREEYVSLWRKAHQFLAQSDFQGASTALERALPVLNEMDLSCDETDTLRFIKQMLLLGKDPARWAPGDAEAIGLSCNENWISHPEFKEVRLAAFQEAARRWPDKVRGDVGAVLIKVWKGDGWYEQEKKGLCPYLAELGGDTQALAQKAAEADHKLGDLEERIKDCAERHDYDGLLKARKEIMPLQGLLHTIKFQESQMRWISSAERCQKLQVVWEDKEARMPLLLSLIAACLEARTDLPGWHYKPRFPEELVVHFFPSLDPGEKQRIEGFLIKTGQELERHITTQKGKNKSVDLGKAGCVFDLIGEMMVPVASGKGLDFLKRVLDQGEVTNPDQKQQLQDFCEQIQAALKSK